MNDGETRLKRMMALTIAMGVLMLLALANRKLPCSFLSWHALGILRLRDVLTILLLAPLGVVIMWLYLLVSEGSSRLWTSLIFVLGVFLLGLGFGIHEPTLAMSLMGWGSLPGGVGESVVFFKELPGHWIFFVGMALSLLSLAMAETSKPLEKDLPGWALWSAAASGIAIAVSLFMNEVDDQRTSIDMGVVLACVVLTALAHWRNGFPSLRRLPITLALYLSLGLGAAAVYGVWLFRLF